MKIPWLRESIAPARKFLGRCSPVLLVMAAGVLLLLLPLGGSGEERETARHPTQDPFVLEEFEEKLSGVLSQIQGAGGKRRWSSL